MASAVLLDLDGVLYVEDDPVPGALEAVRTLRKQDVGLRFVTNTTSRPRAAILERLGRLGFDVAERELMTPAALAAQVCADHGWRRAALLMKEDVQGDLAGVEPADHDVDAVIVGDLGDGFDYRTLNRAFRHVMDGAALVALQRNRYWMTPDGLSLDVGPFVAALEYATDREALVVGKPSRDFFAAVLADLGADQAVMVGDDVESDVGGAQAAGLTGVLVRTGKYREDALTRSGVQPDAVLDSVADLPEWLRDA